MKISAYIIAYNEADKIRDCINSVLWADEIILIDSHSDDGTSEIAESLGAKIVNSISKKTDYLVVGSQKPTIRKINEAKDLNIKILSEEDWNKITN